MPVNVLFSAGRWDEYHAPVAAALTESGLDARLRQDFAPDDVDYIIYDPQSALRDFSPFTRLKAVMNLWAGVEAVTTNPTIKVPLTRMVDQGLTQGMVEYVCGHVLRHHLNIDRYIGATGWDPVLPPLAEDRPVSVLGLGELGQKCAAALRDLGFPVTGWSRTAKDVAGVTCLSGDQGLAPALSTAQILVLLLPDTPATRDILNAATLAMMPSGAMIVNAGRGPLINDDALIAALDRGHIAHATLDAFRVEPLPSDHAFWRHPGITVTPHIAAETRPSTAARVIAENIRRSENKEPLLHVVDRGLGY